MEKKTIAITSGSISLLGIIGILLLSGQTIAYPVIIDPHIVNFSEGLTPNEIQVNWEATVQLNDKDSEVLTSNFLLPIHSSDETIEEMFIQQVEIVFKSKYPEVVNANLVEDKLVELEDRFADKRTLAEIESVRLERAEEKERLQDSLSEVQ